MALLDTGYSTIDIEEMVPITQEEVPTPQQAPVLPVISEDIEIVDNDIPVDDFVASFEDTDEPIQILPYYEEVKDEVIEEEIIPFVLVEQKPTFEGKNANEFSRWVNTKLVYPEIAKENGSQGRVYLSFIVDKDGSVTDVKVLRSSSDATLDNEAVRVVKSSPKWEPGRQRDRAVKVTYTFPVVFTLR
ncbi:energy transducer TonB [bacterium]|nr:energy transducer TonB [bacterium]